MGKVSKFLPPTTLCLDCREKISKDKERIYLKACTQNFHPRCLTQLLADQVKTYAANNNEEPESGIDQLVKVVGCPSPTLRCTDQRKASEAVQASICRAMD